MSTVPRVSSAIAGRPVTLRTALAHQPALAETFRELYGELWSNGIVPHSLTETARLRNARVTDCAFCKNVRFAGPLADGLDETQVDLIRDGYARSALSADQQLVLAWTDAVLAGATADSGVRSAMAARFAPAEIVELTLAIALFVGMSKVLISLGTEPEAMATTILPTPGTTGAH